MDRVVKDYFERFSVPAEVVSFVSRPIGHFIDGRETLSGQDPIDLVEPFTQRTLTELAAGDMQIVDQAVHSSWKALNGTWGRLSPLERQKLMLRLAEAMEADAAFLAHLEAIDVGKAISDARSIDVAGAIANFEYSAGWTSKLDGRTTSAVALPGETLTYTVKEPLGAVAAIIPWNFPLQIVVETCGGAPPPESACHEPRHAPLRRAPRPAAPGAGEGTCYLGTPGEEYGNEPGGLPAHHGGIAQRRTCTVGQGAWRWLEARQVARSDHFA
ncbi:protein of unknown function (plasmid) [Shinella sp. WSC3-e]|nr:hypothetical protein SHINE37_100250 [Rhizobiaceae bacterium]CAK7261801.1 protein of unknown function [Shinella sp. WSC3-e]